MIGTKYNLFLSSKKHLAKSKETWGSHCVFAFIAGAKLLYAGIASIVHGIIPAFFEGTAAITVIKLYHRRLVNHPNPDYAEYIDNERRNQ